MRDAGCFGAILNASGSPAGAQTVSFVEPEAGRTPLTLLDDRIAASLGKTVARGVTVRAILEPCAGDSFCPKPNKDGIAGFTALPASGIQTKWANEAFPKRHARRLSLTGRTRWCLRSTSNRRDSRRGGLWGGEDDAPLIADFNRVFAQDWGSDAPIKSCSQLPQDRWADATVQNCATPIVSPDHGREAILGLIASAKASFKIQVEQVDPQTARGIVPAMVAAVKAGVRLQLLMDNPTDQPDNQAVSDAINAAGGKRVFRRTIETHAKMMVIDGQKVSLEART